MFNSYFPPVMVSRAGWFRTPCAEFMAGRKLFLTCPENPRVEEWLKWLPQKQWLV